MFLLIPLQKGRIFTEDSALSELEVKQPFGETA